MKSAVATVLITFLLTIGMLAQAPQVPAERGQRAGRGNQPPGPPQNLAWVDRTGKVLGKIGLPQAAILDPAISPDGKKVAVRGRDNQAETEHIYLHEGDKKSRLTTNEGSERHNFWSPKGDKIVFSTQTAGQGQVSNLFIRSADGSGKDIPLVVSEGIHKWSPSWSADGKTVVYHTNQLSNNARDIWVVDVATGKASALVETAAVEALPRFSLDGKFVAYQADEAADGKFEVWVTTFPRSESRWKISTAGGIWPRWDKDQIYYWQGNDLVSVKFKVSGKNFTVSPPEKLFTSAQAGMGSGNVSGYNYFYDFLGGKFVVVQRPAAPAPEN